MAGIKNMAWAFEKDPASTDRRRRAEVQGELYESNEKLNLLNKAVRKYKNLYIGESDDDDGKCSNMWLLHKEIQNRIERKTHHMVCWYTYLDRIGSCPSSPWCAWSSKASDRKLAAANFGSARASSRSYKNLQHAGNHCRCQDRRQRRLPNSSFQVRQVGWSMRSQR